MHILTLLLVSLAVVSCYKPSRNPLKTKKYKCIEIGDDEDIQIVKKSARMATPTWPRGDEELRPIGSVRAAAAPSVSQFPSASGETIEVPLAHKVKIQKLPAKASGSATVPSSSTDNSENVQKDHNGRPLVLSPKHCQQVKHYADMYGVKDVKSWVKRNCTFAKMYLPGATCEEIDILVASCYKNKYLV